MPLEPIDWSSRSKARVYALTALGTLFCIAFAFAFDSFSFETWRWSWGTNPINNVIIPGLLAPPLLFLLLWKLRELAIAHHELLHVAATDGLTSCLNRRAFTAMVDAYLDRVSASEASDRAGAGADDVRGALLILDVDHFKAVNDRFGHDTGDEALKMIARTIRSSVRDIDLVGRMGGEEFGIFLPGLDARRSASVAERIRSAIDAARFPAEREALHLSVSIGGTAFSGRTSFGELYRAADQRLYAAKRTGRNRVVLGGTAPRKPATQLTMH